MSIKAGISTGVVVRSIGDADKLMETVRASAARARDWFAAQTGDPLAMLKRLKFEPVGFHPLEDRALNVVEQINQTWTYAVAIAAARQLLLLHPDAGGFRLTPGAHFSQPLDIMSEIAGLVGAETFAAVHPRNNGKLDADLTKMAEQTERYRYVFFMSPAYPGNERRPSLERSGVEPVLPSVAQTFVVASRATDPDLFRP